MFNRKNPLATMMIAALLGHMTFHPGKAAPPPPPKRGRTPGRNVQRGLIRLTGSRYRPHQSSRECLRRIGGAMWEQFKRDDRVRRGLPADKTTGA